MYFPLIFLFILVVPAVVIPWNLKKQTSPYRTILECMITVSILVIGVLAAARGSGSALGEQLMAVLQTAAETLAGTKEFVNAAGLGQLSYSERVQLIVGMYGLLNALLPSVVLIASAVVSFFLYWILSKWERKRNLETVLLMPFRYFRWPASLMMGFLMMFVLSFLLERVPELAGMQLYLNINLLFEFAVALQGIAAVSFLFNLWRFPKILPVLAGIFGMGTGIGRMILFVLGAADYMFNLRVRMIRR